MAIRLQFLCVIIPIQTILGLRRSGAFAASHPMLETISPFDGRSGDVLHALDGPDGLEPSDPAERLMRSRQKWARRAFRAGGGYFIGGGGTEWYDDHLYCSSTMNAFDADEEIYAWMDFGLTPFFGAGETRTWVDLCVAASQRGLKYPCDWFAYDIDGNRAWLQGTAPGLTVGAYDNFEHWRLSIDDEVNDGDV